MQRERGLVNVRLEVRGSKRCFKRFSGALDWGGGFASAVSEGKQK